MRVVLLLLTTMVPPAFVAGDMKKALKKMGTKEGVERLT